MNTWDVSKLIFVISQSLACTAVFDLVFRLIYIKNTFFQPWLSFIEPTPYQV